jgi:hypothetical protein
MSSVRSSADMQPVIQLFFVCAPMYLGVSVAVTITLCHIYNSQKRKSTGPRLGEWGGQEIGPPLPNHVFETEHTTAPSCSKIMLARPLSCGNV